MDFSTAVRTCLSKYVTFTGRASRSEFWWFYLFTILVTVAAAIVDQILHTREILPEIAHLAFLLPTLAASVRRLHDTDHSGWWLLIVLVPIVGIILLIYWWVKPTSPATNIHGVPPLQPVAYPLD